MRDLIAIGLLATVANAIIVNTAERRDGDTNPLTSQQVTAGHWTWLPYPSPKDIRDGRWTWLPGEMYPTTPSYREKRATDGYNRYDTTYYPEERNTPDYYASTQSLPHREELTTYGYETPAPTGYPHYLTTYGPYYGKRAAETDQKETNV